MRAAVELGSVCGPGDGAGFLGGGFEGALGGGARPGGGAGEAEVAVAVLAGLDAPVVVGSGGDPSLVLVGCDLAGAQVLGRVDERLRHGGARPGAFNEDHALVGVLHTRFPVGVGQDGPEPRLAGRGLVLDGVGEQVQAVAGEPVRLADTRRGGDASCRSVRGSRHHSAGLLRASLSRREHPRAHESHSRRGWCGRETSPRAGV